MTIKQIIKIGIKIRKYVQKHNPGLFFTEHFVEHLIEVLQLDIKEFSNLDLQMIRQGIFPKEGR